MYSLDQIFNFGDGPFSSPRAVLDNAKDHIDSVDVYLKAFFEENVCSRIIDYDPQTGEYIHKIRFSARILPKLPARAFDALSNLRAVLDHVAYAAAVALTGRTGWRLTKFPFGKDRDSAERQFGRDASDIPSEIRSFFLDFKPYVKGGDRALWALNQIRNHKTHRILVPMQIRAGAVEISDGAFDTVALSHWMWDAANNEIELFRTKPGPARYDLNFSYFVALSGTEITFAGPAVHVLRELFSKVEKIVSDIERETSRLNAARI